MFVRTKVINYFILRSLFINRLESAILPILLETRVGVDKSLRAYVIRRSVIASIYAVLLIFQAAVLSYNVAYLRRKRHSLHQGAAIFL